LYSSPPPLPFFSKMPKCDLPFSPPLPRHRHSPLFLWGPSALGFSPFPRKRSQFFPPVVERPPFECLLFRIGLRHILCSLLFFSPYGEWISSFPFSNFHPAGPQRRCRFFARTKGGLLFLLVAVFIKSSAFLSSKGPPSLPLFGGKPTIVPLWSDGAHFFLVFLTILRRGCTCP